MVYVVPWEGFMLAPFAVKVDFRVQAGFFKDTRGPALSLHDPEQDFRDSTVPP